jgi:hypothetical protein
MRTMDLTIDDIEIELDIKNRVLEKIKKIFGYVPKPVSTRSGHFDNYEEVFWFNPRSGIGLIMEVFDNSSSTSKVSWTITDPMEPEFETIRTFAYKGIPSKAVFWFASLVKSSKPLP